MYVNPTGILHTGMESFLYTDITRECLEKNHKNAFTNSKKNPPKNLFDVIREVKAEGN